MEASGGWKVWTVHKEVAELIKGHLLIDHGLWNDPKVAHSVGENCNPTSCLTKLTIVFLIKYTPITCDNANTNCPLMLLNQDFGEFGHLVLTLSHLKKHMQDTRPLHR
jgi:hypothetical protein